MRAVLVHVAAQRQLARERGGRDARYAPDRLERRVEEPIGGAGLVESVTDDLHLHREQPRRVEARRDREQPLEAPEQQSGADEQHERKRHLRDDERAADAPVSAGRVSRAMLQVLMRIAARRLQRRHQPASQTDQRRDAPSESEHGAIDADCAGARQARWAERHERAHAEHRHGHADAAAHGGEEQVLGEQLPDEPTAAGAERGTQRELGAPVDTAGEQQVRHVHACDDEHQADRAEDDEERRLDAASEVVVQ